MKDIIKWMGIFLLLSATPAHAFTWRDWWQTPDQQGAVLLSEGKAKEAAQQFKNKDWQSVALYRAGNFAQAYNQFNAKKTSDSQYNAGNAAAYMGHYRAAIAAYDKAIALNPNNTDAITNREIVKKLMQEKKPPQNNSENKNQGKDSNKNQSEQKNNADKKTSQDKSQQKNADAKNNDNQKENEDKKENHNQDQNSEKNASQSKQPSGQDQQKDSEQVKNNNDNPENKNGDAKQQASSAEAKKGQNQNEDKQQLLRRLADDPGGLLRQKFLRDYLRRHARDDDLDQGEN